MLFKALLPFVIDLFDATSDGLASLPASILGLLQQNFLEKSLEEFAEPQNVYAAMADTEEFSTEIGTTLTKTRPGLKAPIQLATNAATAADDGALNNGINPLDVAIEQYALTPQTYEDGMDLDLIGTEYAIVNRFGHNVKVNIIQGYQTRDILARDTLLGGYLTGTTQVTAGIALGAGGSGVVGTPGNVSVSDTRHLQTIVYNGKVTPVSNAAGTQLLCTVYPGGSTTGTYQVYVVGATVDTVNATSMVFVGTGTPSVGTATATRSNGTSGILSLAMPPGAAGKTLAVGDIIQGNDAPKQFLAGPANLHYSQITSANLLTQSQILDAKAYLGDNAMEPLPDGTYLFVGSERSIRGLYGDADFKQAFQGLGQSPFFRKGRVDEYLGVTFVTTTNAPRIAIPGGGYVHVPMLIGQGALIDAWFEGMEDWASSKFNDAFVTMDTGIAQVITPPIDRLRRKLKQSWITIRDMTAPTDVTVNSNVILTAGLSRRKRAVALVHGASV